MQANNCVFCSAVWDLLLCMCGLWYGISSDVVWEKQGKSISSFSPFGMIWYFTHMSSVIPFQVQSISPNGVFSLFAHDLTRFCPVEQDSKDLSLSGMLSAASAVLFSCARWLVDKFRAAAHWLECIDYIECCMVCVCVSLLAVLQLISSIIILHPEGNPGGHWAAWHHMDPGSCGPRSKGREGRRTVGWGDFWCKSRQ